jgi:hypothetical protein
MIFFARSAPHDAGRLNAIVRARRWCSMQERGEYTRAADWAKAEKVNKNGSAGALGSMLAPQLTMLCQNRNEHCEAQRYYHGSDQACREKQGADDGHPSE